MAEAEVDLHRVDHDERSPLLRSSSQNTSTTSISFLGILIPSLGLEKEYYWVIFPFLLGTLADFGDGAIFKTAYVRIGIDLHDEYLKAWLFLVYTIVLTIGQPLYAVMKDELGWSGPLVVSYLTFSIGLIGCFLSPNVGWLLGARFVTAAGSAGMVYVPNLFVNDEVAPNLIPNWIALFGFVALLARLAGSLLAGAGHIDYLRWLFLGELVLPVLALSFVMWKMNIFRNLHDRNRRPVATDAPSHTSRSELWSNLLSTLPLILSVGCLCAGTSLLADQLEFKLEVEATMLTLGIVFLLTFFGYQKYLRSKNSAMIVVPIGLSKFERMNLVVVFVGSFLLNGACSALTFLLPQIDGSAGFSTTFRLWAYWVGEFVGYLYLASYAQRYNQTRWPLIVGAASCSVASASMYICWEDMRTLSGSLPLIAVYGVGSGTIVAGFRSQLMRTLERKHNYKTKVYNLLHIIINIADLIFTATSNALIQNANSNRFPNVLFGGGYQGAIQQDDVSFVNASNTSKDALLASSSSAICLVMVPSLLVMAIIVCFVKDHQSEG